MLFRKTMKTKKKQIFTSKDNDYKSKSLYRLTTYWFLIIPIYSYEEFID